MGKKNNEAFITDSAFGQMFSKLFIRDSEFTCLQNHHTAFECSIEKKSEDATDDKNSDLPGIQLTFRLAE